MKKHILWAMSLCLLAALLCGCGSTASNTHGLDPSDPQSVTIWHYYDGEQLTAFNQLVEEFNATTGKEQGIVVIAESKGNINTLIDDVNASAQKEVGAASLPDIFQCYLDMVADLNEAGVLCDLNQYVTPETKERYVDSFIQEGTFPDGTFKLFPVIKSTEVLMLNKTDWDAFAQATGCTQEELATWEGLAATAERYYDWSGGKSFFGLDSHSNYIILGCKQLGHTIFNVENGSMTLDLDRDTAQRLWDNFYVPYVKGYYSQTGRFRSDDLKAGQIIAQGCSISSATYFPKEVADGTGSHPIDCLVLPYPVFQGGEPYATQQGASMAVTVSNEREEYASVVFLEWMTQREQNLALSVASGYMPVRKDACTPEALADYIQEQGLEETVSLTTLGVAMAQREDYTLFTSADFPQAYAARRVLDSCMIDPAVEDAAQVAQEESDRQRVLEHYLSQDYFDQWYEGLMAQLSPYEGG